MYPVHTFPPYFLKSYPEHCYEVGKRFSLIPRAEGAQKYFFTSVINLLSPSDPPFYFHSTPSLFLPQTAELNVLISAPLGGGEEKSSSLPIHQATPNFFVTCWWGLTAAVWAKSTLYGLWSIRHQCRRIRTFRRSLLSPPLSWRYKCWYPTLLHGVIIQMWIFIAMSTLNLVWPCSC
jgi:hypothetical protein